MAIEGFSPPSPPPSPSPPSLPSPYYQLLNAAPQGKAALKSVLLFREHPTFWGFKGKGVRLLFFPSCKGVRLFQTVPLFRALEYLDEKILKEKFLPTYL